MPSLQPIASSRRSPGRLLAPALLGLAGLAPSLLAQAQPVEAYWSDRWNARYDSFSDVDADGTFDLGEVRTYVDPNSPHASPAAWMRVTEENGEVVTYWAAEFSDRILRAVDLDDSGLLSGAEITVFRDSGALDGTSWPRSLDITDDGAVWWISGQSLSLALNGLMRLQDLNADGDAADPGEQVQLVDGNGVVPVEHDLGTANMTGWSMRDMASAGNGVLVYGETDHCIYRFEDFNSDGDVTDAGESILFLNHSGERPDLPVNPDFADGTLKAMQTMAGFPTYLHMASTMEDGERAFYFGTTVSPFSTSGTNVDGDAINFVIFRAVDGNADGDVNDAGEVEPFLDASADSANDLLILREMDALDGGTLYAVGLLPYPVLSPGPNGNTWIHRFEDLNGDGDATDAGEQQLNVFDLQVHGINHVFPDPPTFGNVMADPWDFSVRRITRFTDMGGATAGVNGKPVLQGSGTLEPSSPFSLDLTDGPASDFILLWISLSSSPLGVFGGTLHAFPFSDQFLLGTDSNGEFSASTAWPPGVPAGTDDWFQFLCQDLSVVYGITLSNGVKATTP